jgi:hypothetical protein
MVNLYNKIDDTLVYGAQKVAEAWNWTTGKTKKDLANSILTITPVLKGGAFLFDFGLVTGGVIIPVCIYYSLREQKINREQEILEKKSSESGAMIDPYFERIHKFQGKIDLSLGGGVAIINQGRTLAFVGVGLMLEGFSHYVMRGDYLPPRKNVLSRAKDKLTDMLKRPQLAPAINEIDFLSTQKW